MAKKPPKGMMKIVDTTQGGGMPTTGTAKKLKGAGLKKPAPKGGFKMFRRKTP